MHGSSSIGEICMRNMHNENGLEIVHENCPPDSPNIGCLYEKNNDLSATGRLGDLR